MIPPAEIERRRNWMRAFNRERANGNGLTAYDKRRQAEAVTRWQLVAKLRREGKTLKQIGELMKISATVVHKLEQKWHSYRIDNNG